MGSLRWPRTQCDIVISSADAQAPASDLFSAEGVGAAELVVGVADGCGGASVLLVAGVESAGLGAEGVFGVGDGVGRSVLGGEAHCLVPDRGPFGLAWSTVNTSGSSSKDINPPPPGTAEIPVTSTRRLPSSSSEGKPAQQNSAQRHRGTNTPTPDPTVKASTRRYAMDNTGQYCNDVTMGIVLT